MSEKNSRRSSILKLPKARQPLQCMESGESPTENSPTKFKRRVSFAEKKHVKEFCDSIEQGTVWDNTYEESDMSGSKNVTPDANSVTATNPEISSTNEGSKLRLEESESMYVAPAAATVPDAHEPEALETAASTSLESTEISQIILSKDPALLANKENIPGVLELVDDDNELIVNEANFEASSNRIAPFSVYCDEEVDEQNESVNKTAADMDFTMPVNDNIEHDGEVSPNIAQEVDSSTDEFTSHDKVHKTQIFQDVSMEITEAIDYSESAPPSREFVEEKTQFFHNKSMELTEAVRPDRLHLGLPEKTVIFHDKSMEMTGLVPPAESRGRFNQLPDEKTQLFTNQSMEFTGAVPTRNLNNFLPEKNQMTESVMSNFSSLSRPRFEEKTQHFNNQSMELTEAIDCVMPNKYSEPKSQVFYNDSMEINENSSSKSPCNPLNQSTEERTQFFHNKSMELTEAISPKISNYNLEERTQFFQNKSMELTEAISPKISNYVEDKTQFFANKSMDFTELIPPTSQRRTPSPQESSHNYFMDRSTSSAYLKRPYQVLRTPDGPCERPKAPRRQEVSSKYLEELHRILYDGIEENKFFDATKKPLPDLNDSMEMTAVVASHFREINQPAAALASPDSPETSGMQFTRVVTPFKQPHTLSQPPDSPGEDTITTEAELNASERSENISNCDADSSSHVTSPDELLEAPEKHATMFKDISYDFTAPIVLHKDINNLEDTEMPSFIQNISDEPSDAPILESSLLPNHEDSADVGIPDLTITEEVKLRRRTYLVRQNTSESVECPPVLANPLDPVTNVRLAKELSKFEAPEDKIQEENSDKRDREVREISNVSPERLTPPCEPSTYVRECSSSFKKTTRAPEAENSCKKRKLHSIVMRENDLITRSIEDTNKMRQVDVMAKRLRAERRAKTKVTLESSEVKDNPIDNASPYDAMEKYVTDLAEGQECPWKILKLTPERVCIQYEVNCMVLGIIFDEADAEHGIERVNRVRLVSRLNDEERALVKMMDYLILRKINLEELKIKFNSYDHVVQLIQYVTDEINFIFDFYDELKRLTFTNKIHIEQEKISLNIWTLSLNTILKIVIHMKPFTEITPSDIDVSCILGHVRTDDVKNLIQNIRRDDKFLTFYLKDVKEYIEIMEETVKKVL